MLFGFVCLSAVRSAPVYGKLDFITLPNNPWWPRWRPMIEAVYQEPEYKPIYTDVITRYVLENIFDYPVYPERIRERSIEYINVDNLSAYSNFQPIVNLSGFEPSWVPRETRHWRQAAGNTDRYYHYMGKRGRDAVEMIKRHPPAGIPVYY